MVAGQLASGVVSVVGNGGFRGGAFAALKQDGSVVTWGSKAHGGDSSSVARALASDIVKVTGKTHRSGKQSCFCAIKRNGSAVSWGHPVCTNFHSDFADSLTSGVVDIVSNSGAVVAIKEDGSFFSFGKATYGGDSTHLAGTRLYV